MKRTLQLSFLFWLFAAGIHAGTVEQYSVFELELKGPSKDNPFKDVQLSADFKFKNRTCFCEGFYDGDGIYRIRFMPDDPGIWTYTTKSSSKELNAKSGTFTCTPHSPDNHGPVKVRNTFDFGYADETPFYPVGTTCYAWVHQPEELVQQTLASLAKTKFNKIRMTVMPKNYDVYINKLPVATYGGQWQTNTTSWEKATKNGKCISGRFRLMIHTHIYAVFIMVWPGITIPNHGLPI